MEEEDSYIAEAAMGGLCTDLIKHVISSFPDKSLARMKCTSKGWYRFMSQHPSTPPSTFFCQFMSPADQQRQVIFVDNTKLERGREFLEHDFTKFISADYCLIGSSKRWLLVYCPSGSVDLPFIYDRDKIDSWNCPPPVSDRESRPYRVGMGVASGWFSDGYKLVAFVLGRQETSIGACMEFRIYSSTSIDIPRRWKRQLSEVLNTSPTIINVNNTSNHIPCLFRKGMLNWVLDGYILVYHVDKNVAKLIRLPDSNNDHELVREHYTQKLWDWNGCMYYSNRHIDKIFIWAYDSGSLCEDAILYMQDYGNWRLIHIIDLATLVSQHPGIFGPKQGENNICFEPCGFNGYMQMLYVQLPGMIVCYSLETRRLIKAWIFGESRKSYSSLGNEALLHQTSSLK